MARRPLPEIIRFDPGEPEGTTAVVEALRAMAEARRGWANFEPAVPDELDASAASTRGGVFSNRGPAVPLCTWAAPTVDRKGRTGPQSIGVQHGISERARPRLSALGLEVPVGWAPRADNPKRGLVVEIPDEVDLAMVVDWLLAAGEALATVPLTGRWYATLHRR
jgi:hypothetical protein